MMFFGLLGSLLGGGALTREKVAAGKMQGSFNKKELSGLDLSGLEFIQCEFNGANLEGVNFAGSTLTQCEFKDANLRGVNFQGATITQTELKRADLRGAHLQTASFEQCNLSKANLDGTDYTGASFSQCDLNGTPLAKAKASGRDESLADARAHEHEDAMQAAMAQSGGDVNAMMAAAQAQAQQMMQNATKPEQLAPIEGVSLEVYATVSARAASDPNSRPAILAEYGLDEARFMRADQGWQARMRQADDPMAAAAIAGEYGKYFAAAGQGQYGAAGQASAAHIGMHGQAGAPGAGAEPCTLERYAEIMGAQSAWAQQGRDVNAMLQQQFSMTALDWSNMGAYWSMKSATDFQVAMRIGDLQQQYEQRYLGAGGGPDDDLSL